jgi:plasmid stabilization system protein ParE
LAPARREFDRLSIPVAAAVLETLDRSSARARPYRIIYERDETERLVRVVAIGHRRDVHRRR